MKDHEMDKQPLKQEVSSRSDPGKLEGKLIKSTEPKAVRHFSFSSFLIHFLMLGLAAVVVLPLTLPLMFAFKTNLEFNYDPWRFIPKEFIWDNFMMAWESVKLGQGMFNTAIVCLGAIALTIPPAALAGYVFAKYRSKIMNVLFYVIIAGFFIPVMMVLIPLYKMEVNLSLVNTLAGVFLPIAAFGIPFWTMIYRSFYNTLPAELSEAAKIDGAGHFGTYFKIMMPLTKPATVLAVLMTFMGAWSDYLLTLIIINSNELFTLQLRIQSFTGNRGANFMPQYSAGVIIAAAPTIILYIIFHKWIMEGQTLAGAVKG